MASTSPSLPRIPPSGSWPFFGTIKIGGVAVGLHTLLKPREYEFILRDCRAQVLVVHESLLTAIESIRDSVPSLRQVVVIGQPTCDDDVRFDDWIRGESSELAAEPTHRDDFCSLNYSSGTTGEPKGVHHAHKDYAHIGELSGAKLFGLTADDVRNAGRSRLPRPIRPRASAPWAAAFD